MNEHARRAAHARGQCDAPRRDQIESARGRTQIGDHASGRPAAQAFLQRPEQILRADRAHIEKVSRVEPMRGKASPVRRAGLAGGKFVIDENDGCLRFRATARGHGQRKTGGRRAVAHAGGGGFIKRAGKKPAQSPVERAGGAVPPERGERQGR